MQITQYSLESEIYCILPSKFEDIHVDMLNLKVLFPKTLRSLSIAASDWIFIDGAAQRQPRREKNSVMDLWIQLIECN